ncbi:MAG: SUMF1/EgtB/PvdO family nonheme iron enzyme [Chloroflexota bacterium]
MMHHVFISYSHEDRLFMQRVQTDLQKAGLVVWTDEQLQPGTTDWQIAIEQAIRNTGCVMCIFSPDAAQSQWVREELNYARLNKIQILPLLARGDETTSVPFGFSALQWVDIRNRDAYINNMKRLLIELKKRYANVPLSPQNPRTTATVPGLGSNYPAPTTPPKFAGILPKPFAWCEIPTGVTKVDGVKHDVDFFYMSKYPITVAQYAVFAKADDGYRNDTWWQFSEHGQQWHAEHPEPDILIFSEDAIPRAQVSWYEAIAFCKWLQQKGRSPHTLTLPTEWQWQRAAQGDDERLYPWGDRYQKNRCNTLKSAINRPTPVETYPGGKSPYDVYDMCGNVSEWCLNDYTMFSSDVTTEAPRVLRGGAYDSGRSFAQVVIRNYANPDQQSQTVGFRIVATGEFGL